MFQWSYPTTKEVNPKSRNHARNVGGATKISLLVKPCHLKSPICRVSPFSLFSCLLTGSYTFLPLIRPRGGRGSHQEPAGIAVLLSEGWCDTEMYRNPGGMGPSDSSRCHNAGTQSVGQDLNWMLWRLWKQTPSTDLKHTLKLKENKFSAENC